MVTRLSQLKHFSVNQMIGHLKNPLYRNGYLMILSSGLTSVLGLLYWILAARLYTPEAVGVNSAALAAATLLSGISQLNAQSMVVRFLPISGQATLKLIVYTYLITISLGLLTGFIFLLGLDYWSPALHLIKEPLAMGVWFVASVSITAIFAMQDAILAGLRRATWIPLENVLFAILKIVLLVALAGSVFQQSIFISWTVSLVLLVIPINYFIFKRFIPQHVETTEEFVEPIHLPQIISYIAVNYLGSLFTILGASLLPIIVLQTVGAEDNAYFYPGWAIYSALQLVAYNMVTSLTVEASREKHKLLFYSWRIFLRVMQLLIPLVMVIVLGAPLILRLYGENYSNVGANLLRFLAVATIPNAITIIYIGIARVQLKVVGVIVVDGTMAILGIGLSYLFLPLYGITGIGIAWLISQITVAIGVLLIQAYPMLRQRKADANARNAIAPQG